MNYKDIGFKAVWTGVAAVLGYLLVVVPDLPTVWAPVITLLLTAALAYVRQRTGKTPPDLGTPVLGSN